MWRPTRSTRTLIQAVRIRTKPTLHWTNEILLHCSFKCCSRFQCVVIVVYLLQVAIGFMYYNKHIFLYTSVLMIQDEDVKQPADFNSWYTERHAKLQGNKLLWVCFHPPVFVWIFHLCLKKAYWMVEKLVNKQKENAIKFNGNRHCELIKLIIIMML